MAGGGASPAEEAVERLPQTVGVIEQAASRGLHHGVQLCVLRDGRPVADLAIGGAIDGGPFSPRTLLPWLSAGKPATAVLIMQQVERGRLDLDAPVAEVLPEFAQNGKDGVSVRMLLTHTAGLAKAPLGWPQATWSEMVARVCAAPLAADGQPGQGAAYDPGKTWVILGEILRGLTGRPIDQLIREALFVPLGMHDSWMALSSDVHTAYGDRIGVVSARNLEGRLQPTHGHTAALCKEPNPGSSCRGPAHDLVRLYEMLRCGGELDGVRILRDETVAEMTRPQRVGRFDSTFQHTIDFGLGVIVNSNRYGADTVPYGFGRWSSGGAFGHGGAQSSIAFADPGHGLAIAAIANGAPGEQAHQRRFREMLSALYADLGLVPPAH